MSKSQWEMARPNEAKLQEILENGEENEFAEVESLDDAVTNDGEEYVSKKLRIIKKISIDELFAAGTKQIVENSEAADLNNKPLTKTVPSSYYSKIGSSGNYSQIGSSGYYSQIASSGNYAKIGSSGYGVQIASSGYDAQIGSSGNCAKITSIGKNVVICCAGRGCAVKGKKGTWITLAEWKYIDNEYVPVCVKTKKIDGVKIKEDTFYILKNRKFTEIEK